MNNYEQYNEAEKFFLSCLRERLFIQAQYNHLPTCTCFSYSITELIRNCRRYLESDKKINHLSMTKDFYDFMKEDMIFKLIDESQYYVLLNWIKEVANDSANIKECYTYFLKTRSIYSVMYLNKLKEYLINLLKSDSDKYEIIEKLTNVFVNELLSQKISYLYFVTIHNEFNKGEHFDSIYELIDYLMNEKDTENIEMYLPLMNCRERDIEFIEGKQEIVLKDDNVYYCKIYANCVDYYVLCETNKRRIESLLNFFKFYRDSNIDFDYSKKVKIIRKKLDDEFDVDFRKILTYKYFVGKETIIKQTIKNLEILDENNNILYYKINNILHYAEKDNDFLSSSSYVDNWIALESLIKLSEVHSGYEGVKYFVPKMLAVKYFRQELNATLKEAYKDNPLSVEEFISKCINEDCNMFWDKVKNQYYKYRLQKYSQIISEYNKLQEYIDEIQKRIELDIKRIYLIRNEYVHASNININNNMQKIKLKRILADSIDCFNKSLNPNVSRFPNVDGENIFSDLGRKYLVCKTTLDLYTNKVNHGRKIGKNDIVSTLSKSDIICNVIFERRETLNKMVYIEEK